MVIKKMICICLAVTMLVSMTACAGSAAGGTEPLGSQKEEASSDAVSGQDAKTSEVDADSSEVDAAADTDPADAAAASAGATNVQKAAEAGREEISAGDISVLWEDSRVFSGTSLGKYVVMPTYAVKGYEDVPFIRASDYLNVLCDGRQRTQVKDGIMKIDLNGTEAVIDSKEDTVYFENPAKFRLAGDVDGGIVEKQEFNVITPSVKNKSVQTGGSPLTVSLKDYNLPAVAFEDDILMPFLALQNTFGVISFNNKLVYNGKDYFNAAESVMNAVVGKNENVYETPYMKAYYSGPFSEKTNSTQAYADYAYYTTCLLLDLTFGHKEEKNITTFDEYFTRINAKKSMTSTSPGLALTSEVLLLNYLFDSGHDSIVNTKTVYGSIETLDKSDASQVVDDIKSSENGEEFFDEARKIQQEESDLTVDTIMGALLEKGLNIPESVSLMGWMLYFENARPKDYGSERLDYTGDTAVIYFNAFKDDTSREPSYYLDPIKKEDEAVSTFAFVYNCFEDIKKHDEVKNVVINIADNGGGAASALVSVLGFLSEDGEVRITLQDIPAGSYKEEYYHVDTNMDGVADDQDGYGGKYDFYIMTSGQSYSCGNALPYFAQKNGLAKIIGSKPGGGDCVLGTLIDAYGYCGAYSGMLKLGTNEADGFVSNEKATEMDFDMMPSILDINNVPWYDPEGIADAVHRYQNGEKTMTYSEGQQSDDLTKILEEIFSGIVDQVSEKSKDSQE